MSSFRTESLNISDGETFTEVSVEFCRRALALVKEKRRAHVLGCAECARTLARAFGADETAAVRAALLHDCTKRLGDDEQLKLCEEYGIILTQADLDSPQVIHAITGAEVARREFRLSEEECGAIRFHTTGRADMTPLEKTVYLADVIEPTRSYDNIKHLRKLAAKDAEKALLEAAANTVALLVKDRRPVHPLTVDMYDFLLNPHRKAQ